MQQFVEDSRVIERLHQEPLSEHLASYASLLKQQGYARTSAQSRTLLVSRFGRWLERNGIDTYTVASQVFDVSFWTMPHLRRSLPLDSPDSTRGTRMSCTPMRHSSERGIVAKWLGLFAVGRVRFERGKARTRTWREVERRPLDWASPSLQREFEVVIMVEVLIGEMFGSNR